MLIPKEATLIEYPHVKQMHDWDCGPAVLSSVLKYQGKDIPYYDLIKALGCNQIVGTTIRSMLIVACQYGIQTVHGEHFTIDILKSSINNGHPVIISVQAWAERNRNYSHCWSEGHFVTCIGYSRDEIYFSDPYSNSITYLSVQDLLKRWRDMDGKKRYVQWGMICLGECKWDQKQVILMG